MFNTLEYNNLINSITTLVNFLDEEKSDLEDHQFDVLKDNLKQKEKLCHIFEKSLGEFEKKNQIEHLSFQEKTELKHLLSSVKSKFIENRQSLEKAQRYHKLLVELCLMNNSDIKVPAYSVHGKHSKSVSDINPLFTFDQDV